MIRKVNLLCSILSLSLFLGFLVTPDLSLATPAPPPMATVDPIIMWSGPVSEIPKDWQLCDGTNNTPDLSDRFIQGVDTGELPGQTGGSHDLILTEDNLPEHKHGFKTNHAGDHHHNFTDTYFESSKHPIDYYLIPIPAEICSHIKDFKMRTTAKGGEHSHSGKTDSAGKSIPFDNRPEYYRLAFITKKYKAPQGDGFQSRYFAPSGGIVMWSGDPQSLPYGWRLCDGSNGVPDLRDRFILGVKNGQDPGETGGSDTIQLSKDNLPSHKHSFNTKKGGSHSHNYFDCWLDKHTVDMGGYWSTPFAWPGDAIETEDTTFEGSHNHSGITDNAGDGDPLDNRPSFYRLAFIISLTDNIKPSRIPKGAITMWSEDQTTIPYGWCFCDGANGTPDLRDRFVLGGQTVGETGGYITTTLSAKFMPKHKHAFTTSSNGLHCHELKDHLREIATFYYDYYSSVPMSYGIMTSDYTSTLGVNEHIHSGTTYDTGESTPFDNRPAFHKLAFIMRIE